MMKSSKKIKTLTTRSCDLKQDPRVAGIDIGATSLFVCAGLADGTQIIREFSTFTADIRDMAAWLKECGTTSIAMESTGVYWIPPYDLLEEEGFEILLV